MKLGGPDASCLQALLVLMFLTWQICGLSSSLPFSLKVKSLLNSPASYFVTCHLLYSLSTALNCQKSKVSTWASQLGLFLPLETKCSFHQPTRLQTITILYSLVKQLLFHLWEIRDFLMSSEPVNLRFRFKSIQRKIQENIQLLPDGKFWYAAFVFIWTQKI